MRRRCRRALSSTCNSPACRARQSGWWAGCTLIIVMTASREQVIRERAHKNGCAAFFGSPSMAAFSGSDLHVARESIAERRLALSTRPRVLLADDYPDIVKAVSRLLALDCEIVGTVADGSALLETAQRLQPDVIVLDVNLPNVDSLAACREITRVNPEMKVIMFTAGRSECRPGVSRGWSICIRLETRVHGTAVDHQAAECQRRLTPGPDSTRCRPVRFTRG